MRFKSRNLDNSHMNCALLIINITKKKSVGVYKKLLRFKRNIDAVD